MNLIFCLKICKWNSLEFTKSSLRFSSLDCEDDVQRGSLENWDCALSVTPLYREAGGARTGLLGEGVWCAPSVHWWCACALSILLGEGVARTGLLGEGVWCAPSVLEGGGGGNLLKGGFIHSLHQFALQFFSANYMNLPKSRVGGYQRPNGAGECVDTTVLSRHLILF